MHPAISLAAEITAPTPTTRTGQVTLSREFQKAEAEHRCLISTSELTQLLKSPKRKKELFSPFPRLYVRRGYWDTISPDERHRHTLRALALKHPSWIFCDVSSALVHGLPVSRNLISNVHILALENTHASHQGRVYRHDYKNSQTQIVDALPATSLAQTIFDCSCRLPFDEALIIADAAQRQEPSAQDQLNSLIKTNSQRKGITKARKVAQYMDGLSESAAESLARAHIIEMGYVIPELQVEFDDPLRKNKKFRVDMLVRREDGSCVIIEIDGQSKYENQDAAPTTILMKERQREALLTTYNLEFMRLHYSDIMSPERMNELFELYRIPRRPYARNNWCPANWSKKTD